MKRQFLILIAISAFVSALSTNAFGQADKTVEANQKGFERETKNKKKMARDRD